MDKADLSHIYQFWFGGQPCTEATAGERVRFWMEQSDETDKVIRRRFGHLIAAAAGQTWDPEQLSRQEAIALVVLSTSFHAISTAPVPRHMPTIRSLEISRGQKLRMDGRLIRLSSNSHWAFLSCTTRT